ncbi:hypothetical protein [Methylohalobius crimeensis]|uniref:hypothetical protein n=1 Tax=Methylohalobius crimeensis TaxID=244365 RepID=UPI0003B3D8BE|nr:hypothetical protein [Methylohalobius crimeensis]
MAHVHGDKKKMVEAAAHAAGGAMRGPGPHGPMMGEMMGPSPMMHGATHSMKTAAKGAAVTAGVTKGGSLMSRLYRHPWLMFGLGVAAGVVVYRYRKEIIATTLQAGEKSRDFVLQQRESLEDIVAESQEEGGEKGPGGKK